MLTGGPAARWHRAPRRRHQPRWSLPSRRRWPPRPPRRAAGGHARGRGRRPGHRAAGHVPVGRRRSDSRGCRAPPSPSLRRAPDGRPRRWRRRGDLVGQRVPPDDGRSGTVGLGQAVRRSPSTRPGSGRVGPGDGRLRRRPRFGVVLLARHRAMSTGIGMAHLPRRCQPRSGHAADRSAPVAPWRQAAPGLRHPRKRLLERPAIGPGGPGRPACARGRQERHHARRLDDSGEEPIPIALPKAHELGSRRARQRPRRGPGRRQHGDDDPLHLGKRLKWRASSLSARLEIPRVGHFLSPPGIRRAAGTRRSARPADRR